MALIDSLVSYWKFDESSGDALDAHGSNPLTDNNGVGTATGILGTARHPLFASSRFFSHGDNSDLSTGDVDFTFAFWIKPDNTNAGAEILSKWVSVGNLEFQLRFNSGFQWAVSGTGSDSNSVTSTTTPSAGNWYHVVAWHDAVNNQIGVSVNAGTPDTASWSGGVHDSTETFRVSNTSDGFSGLIDELGFWKRVLTSQERSDLYNGGAGLAYPFSVGSPITWRLRANPQSPLGSVWELYP